jgi:hypothetical protein
MLYLLIFTVITGSIASFAFFYVYKRHIRKNGVFKEKTSIKNIPKLFGTVNIMLALFFGIWFVINPSAFAHNEAIDSIIAIILLHILFTYFHVLALPLSIGSATLTILIKPFIKKKRFMYYMFTNVMASILLFILTYLILN